jgi:TRAP-type transport system periplasmic protein
MARLLWLLVSVSFVTFGVGASAQEVRLRMASFLPGNASFGVPAKRWVDEVNRRGKGVLQIDLLGPEAVPATEQPNAVKTGVVDLHSGPPAYYHGILIEAETLTLSERSIAELKANGAWNYLNKLHAEKMNVMLLTGFGDGVSFHIYTTKPANLADKDKPFTGFNLRGVPVYKAFFESLGAKMVSIPPGEVYTALERNMVEGYGWPLWGVKELGWLRLTKYRYDPGFFNVSVNIMINLDRWKKLDKKQQEFLAQMSAWLDVEWLKWRAETEGLEEKIQKDEGVQAVYISPEIHKRAHDIFWAELEAASPVHIAYLKKLMSK